VKAINYTMCAILDEHGFEELALKFPEIVIKMKN
jgi:hypothetical protein